MKRKSEIFNKLKATQIRRIKVKNGTFVFGRMCSCDCENEPEKWMFYPYAITGNIRAATEEEIEILEGTINTSIQEISLAYLNAEKEIKARFFTTEKGKS